MGRDVLERAVEVLEDEGMIGPAVRAEVVEGEEVGCQRDVAFGREALCECLEVGAGSGERVENEHAGKPQSTARLVKVSGHLALAARVLDGPDGEDTGSQRLAPFRCRHAAKNKEGGDGQELSEDLLRAHSVCRG
jgi:hypothetical protein